MKEIQLTQNKVALVDDEDYEWLSKYKWHFHSDGYATTYINKKHIFMHRLLLLVKKGKMIDHANGNGLDNRKENLRTCSHKQNGANRKVNKNSTTGYKGVTCIEKDKSYRAQIRVGAKSINIGRYKTSLDAARAYDEAAKKYFGEFANTNF